MLCIRRLTSCRMSARSSGRWDCKAGRPISRHGQLRWERSARVVVAAFFNFSPELVAARFPACGSSVAGHRDQGPLLDRRGRTAGGAGGALAKSPEFARAAVFLGCRRDPDGAGRPLYAGHAELQWPQSPYSRLWHAITLLREYRGDGHIAALLAYRLSGLEALITHTATVSGSPDFGRRLRGWTTSSGRLRRSGCGSAGLSTRPAR